MELKSYAHIARNKLLFQYAPFVRPLVYSAFSINESPIVVLGNQKAGTSAIAALLARATGSSYDIDIAGFRNAEYSALHGGSADFRKLVASEARIEFSKDVVKEPNLTFLYPQLRKAFPAAQVVLITRNPFQNIRSTLNRLSLPGDLPQLSPKHVSDISAIWHSILMNEWVGDPSRTDLNYVGRSAERWQQAADVYLDHQDELTLIRYEDFVVDKQSAIERLAAQLGRPVTHDIGSRVDVQFQPKGKRKVDLRAFFGDNYATIERECARGIEQLYPELTTMSSAPSSQR